MSKIGGNRRRGNAWERECISRFADAFSLIPYGTNTKHQIVSARQESRSDDAQLRDICFRNLGTSALHRLLERSHVQCKTESLNTNKQTFTIDVLDEVATYAEPFSIPILLKRLTVPTKKTERFLGEVVVLKNNDFFEIAQESSTKLTRKKVDKTDYKFKKKRVSYAEHSEFLNKPDTCLQVSFPKNRYYILSLDNFIKILKEYD